MPAKKVHSQCGLQRGRHLFFFVFWSYLVLICFFLFLNTGSFPSNVIIHDGVLGQDCYGSIAFTESWLVQARSHTLRFVHYLRPLPWTIVLIGHSFLHTMSLTRVDHRLYVHVQYILSVFYFCSNTWVAPTLPCESLVFFPRLPSPALANHFHSSGGTFDLCSLSLW